MNRKGFCLAVFSALVLGAFSETETINGIRWYYTVSNGEATLGGSSAAKPAVPVNTVGKITTPTSLGGFPVKHVAKWAFNDCAYLTEIVFSEGITDIGWYACLDCEDLAAVRFPQSLVSIDDYAFRCCYNLAEIDFPESGNLQTIGSYAFGFNDKVTSIRLPNGLRTIKSSAFFLCKELRVVDIPASVSSIGSYVFRSCPKLQTIIVSDQSRYYYSENNCLISKPSKELLGAATAEGSIIIPSGVRSIADYAFNQCDLLTNLVVPVSVTTIKSRAFSECRGLEHLDLPAAINSIGASAFEESGIVELQLPASVTAINNQTFKNCDKLERIYLPDGLTSIGAYAFEGCLKLKSLTIPRNVRTLGSIPFAPCTSLTDLSVDPLNPNFHSVNNCVIDNNNVLVCAASGLSSLIVPDEVVSIGAMALADCTCLTNVVILENVTSIGNYAFERCTQLSEIRLPEVLEKWGPGAFYGCKALEAINIPYNITNIPDHAFYSDAKLDNVVIPDGVSSIDEWAFAYCSELNTITIPASVTFIAENAFYRCPLGNMSIDSRNPRYKIVNGRIYDQTGKKFLNMPTCDIRIYKTEFRPDDASILDVAYSVSGSYRTIDVRPLAYLGGTGWNKVLRPVSFVDAENGGRPVLGPDVSCNRLVNFSWRVAGDVELDDLKDFRIGLYGKPQEILPLQMAEVYSLDVEGARYMVTTNTFSQKSVNDALCWLYAANDADLVLNNGVLSANSEVLAEGDSLYLDRATKFLLRKMGFEVLSGEAFDKAQAYLEGTLNPSGLYGYKVAEAATVTDSWLGVVSVVDYKNLSYSYSASYGAIVDHEYRPIFSRPYANGQVVPYIADVNGDQLWDMVIKTVEHTNLYIRVNRKGEPEFEMSELGNRPLPVGFWSQNTVSSLSGGVLPAMPLSVTSLSSDKLISDADGCIWHYRGGSLISNGWGGTYKGFAEGLMIAAVDWDDDGDLDCVYGTANGRLGLIVNPQVVAPKDLCAEGGMDNVLLSWQPTLSPKVYGYRVYQGDEQIGETQLPVFRDVGKDCGVTYTYSVSALLRFYRPGNSSPTYIETEKSNSISANTGRVSFEWRNVSTKCDEQVVVSLLINNSVNLSPDNVGFHIGYDQTKLQLLKSNPSDLFEGDKILPGSGRFYDFVFDVIAADACETEVVLEDVAVYGINGSKMQSVLPLANAVVSIAGRSESVLYRLGDVDGDGDVDVEDLRLLAKLKNGTGRRYTAQQLKAGDFNGNGKLDNADYQALRALLREKGLL